MNKDLLKLYIRLVNLVPDVVNNNRGLNYSVELVNSSTDKELVRVVVKDDYSSISISGIFIDANVSDDKLIDSVKNIINILKEEVNK